VKIEETTMEDVIRTFRDHADDDEGVRTAARHKIASFLTDRAFPAVLFEIFRTARFPADVHICAAGALRLWFRRNWSALTADEQLSFIQSIHEHLLLPTPAWKSMLLIYRSCRTIYPDFSPFLAFLRFCIQLISLDADSPVVIQAMAISCLLIRSITDYSVKDQQIIRDICSEIQCHLIPFLRDQNLLASAIGVTLIRYCFRILRFSISRGSECFEVIQLSFDLMNAIATLAVTQLIRTAGKLLIAYVYSLGPEFAEGIVTLALHFAMLVNAFPEMPRHLIAPFFTIFAIRRNIVPVSSDLITVLRNASRLTDLEMADFFVNPAVYLATAFPPEIDNENVRSTIGSLMAALASNHPEILQLLLHEKPTEEVVFLLKSVADPLLPTELQFEICQWLIACFSEMTTLPEIAGYFSFLSHVASFFNDEDFAQWHEIVVKSILSDSLVVCLTALGVASEMMHRQFPFPVEVLAKVVDLIPICPTPAASDVLHHFLIFQSDDIMPLVSSIFESLLAALQTSEAFVDNCLTILANIVPHCGDFLIANKFVGVVLDLITAYSRESDYGESLIACIGAIFLSDWVASEALILALFDAIEASDAWFATADSLASAILLFLVGHPALFLSLGLAPRAMAFVVQLLQAGVSTTQENALCDLLAAMLQLNSPSATDFAGAIVHLPFRQPHNAWQVSASLFLAGYGPLDLPVLCAFLETPRPCPYEKHLYAVTLATAAARDPTAAYALPIATALLAAEEQQRAVLGNTAREFTCSHNHPFPVEAVAL
jgi:hypothetical protein